MAKPVEVTNVVAEKLLEQIAKNTTPVMDGNKSVEVEIKSAPLAPNAATEDSLKAIAKKLDGVLVVDNTNSVQPVKLDKVPLAANAATEATLNKIVDVLENTLSVKMDKTIVSGTISVDNFPTIPESVEITNFPQIQEVRVNNTVLAPNAASESTLKVISEKIQDKIEVKGQIEIKASELPKNAASESTLSDMRAILAELLSVEKEEDKAPQYFSVEQAIIGIDVQKAKYVSIQVVEDVPVKVKASNDNENYCEVASFSAIGIHAIDTKFKYLKIEASKSAKLVIVCFYN